MRISKNKTAAIAIAIFLTFSMSASMMLVPTASAHTPAWSIPTYAFINVAPNPVGVGQKVNVIMWLDKVLPNAAAATNSIRMQNYNLTITKPDGTIETHIFATVTDTTSSQYYAYTPDQTGNYTLTFSFPGMTYTWSGDYQNDTYAASSASTTLTVQEEQVTAITSYPLPTQYWTRPIYGENTDWWSISSNWLGTGAPNYGGYSLSGSDSSMNPGDAIGSQTSHIMWTKETQSGGVVGGTTSTSIAGDTYFEGSAYLQRFTNPIILDGMLYYTEAVSFSGSSGNFYGVSYGNTDCVNLRTGELIWSRSDVPALSFGLIFDVQDNNQHGVYQPILFTSSWRAFDADTGKALFNVTGVPSGTKAMGPNGEYLIYVIANAGNATNPDYRLAEWNSTKLWSGDGFSGPGYANGGSLIPTISGTVDGSISTGMYSRYDWNVSISWRNTMTGTPTVIAGYYGDILLCYNGTLPSLTSSASYTYFAVQLNATKGTVGTILWTKTYDAPAGNITVVKGGVDTVNRVFMEAYKETMQWVGYSMDTGAKLWGPTASQTSFDYYGNPAYPYVAGQTAYGRLYSSAFGGILYCYDTKTGDLLWTYGNGGSGNSTNAGYYNAYGEYPTFINAVGNGIIYTVTTEHTVTTPIFKGGLCRAINATDGTEIWTLSSYVGEFFTTSYAIADGYNTWFNGYDNQIYVVGRGSSATTVSASPKVQSYGDNVLIEGSVTDTSAGTTQEQQAADFPNGVACASDASMKDWMGYVYQQKPLPTNFTGVEVTVDVLDSNGNYRNIGTATTDATGMYSLTWTPDIAGNYTVIATFHGTNGYWGSYSETAFNVMAAPAATAAPTSTPASMADQYFLPLSVGMIIAIVIVGALLALLMLRKRP